MVVVTDPRPVLTSWYGSKWALAPWIIEHLGPHDVYVEPYAGSLAVLLRKARSSVEIVNDLDGDIVNLYRVVRDNAAELADALAATPYARAEYDECRWTYADADDPVERARRFMVRANMGFAGDWRTSTFSVSYAPGGHSGRLWPQLPSRVLALCDRLAGVTIENRDAVDLVKSAATKPDAVIYLDPPYTNDTRQPGAYKTDADDDHHDQLLEVITDAACAARIVLSGYDSPRYADQLGSWRRRWAPVVTGGRDGVRSRRTEVLWINQPDEDLFSSMEAS